MGKINYPLLLVNGRDDQHSPTVEFAEDVRPHCNYVHSHTREQDPIIEDAVKCIHKSQTNDFSPHIKKYALSSRRYQWKHLLCILSANNS